jgi:hypothetical protein
MKSSVKFWRWLEVQTEGKRLKSHKCITELKAARAQFELNLAF